MDHFEKEKKKTGYIEAVPRPSEEDLAEFYKNLYYTDGVTATYHSSYTDEELAQKRLRADCTVELIAQNLPKTSSTSKIRALEVGSGEGFVLQSCLDKSWAVTGVDFQAAPIESMNPAVLNHFIEADPVVYLQDLINKNQAFDVVILQNVLEHVLDPSQLMEMLLAIVSGEGCILVQVPNDFSDLQRLAQEQKRIATEYWFCPPQHLNYFNEHNLSQFISSAGGRIADGISDFPIEMYLWGGEQNYAGSKNLGKYAHSARVNLDLFVSRKGLDKYLDFYRACYQVGLGRNLCAVIKKS